MVCLPLHNLHLSELDLPHLTKLAAVGRVSTTEFTKNFKVPAFMSYKKLFHVKSVASCATRDRDLPCTSRVFTWKTGSSMKVSAMCAFAVSRTLELKLCLSFVAWSLVN